MAISAFSNLSITVSDGGTVPHLDYVSSKVYVDIGSGNILKISWNTPTATNNAVDSYKVYVLKYDTASASYKAFYSANIGNVNEFYLKSSLFSSVTQSFNKVSIYVEAISKYGTAYNGTSNVVLTAISKGAGTYEKITTGYAQPVMKRALAFTKLDLAPVLDASGVQVNDSAGKAVYTKASSVQDSTTGWTLMQKFFAKDANGNWKTNDLKYEALTDSSGEVVKDQNDDIIYVL